MSSQANRQVRNEIFNILNRWIEESDLSDEEIAQEAMNAINEFLGEDIVEFTPE
jgi:predicted XRE-type DNA-binding protein